MVSPALPSPQRLATLDDESGRMFALQRYAILDSSGEPQFDKIVALVRDVLEVPIATVSLIDRDRQWLKAASGIKAGECDRRSAFCDYTIRARAVMVVEDATLDPRFVDNIQVTGEPFIRSYAGAPLMTPDGYNLGALCAIDRVPRTFSNSQVGLLERFAALVVDQIELRTLAHHDFLTGAMSRRSFTDLACATLSGGKRAALLCLDIDHFKAFNDAYGHAGGDRVLRAVAGECRRQLRPGDAVGRLGGEEFAVLLVDSDERDALGCAERLRLGIEGLRVGDFRPVTASFGIAVVQSSAAVDEWLSQADSALYAAKRGGRNRSVIHAPSAAAA